MVTAHSSWTTGYFEFQFRSDIVQKLLYNRSVRRLPCVAGVFEIAGDAVVLDHVEPLANPHFERHMGAQAFSWDNPFEAAVSQFVQPIRVFGATLDSLEQAGTHAGNDGAYLTM